MLNVPMEWWTLLVGTLLPAAVALVRDRYASSQVGALLLVALTVVTAVAAEVIVEGGVATFDLSDAGEQFVLLYITAVVAHYGLLKPVGVTGSGGVISQAVPGGIGGGTATIRGTGI